MELYEKTVSELSKLMEQRCVSASEITKEYLRRTEKYDKSINAYITVCEDSALAAAKLADKSFTADENAVLTGIPISVKDNICTAGVRTTCASDMLKDYIPAYNAHVTDKLTDAGAVIVGKANLDEFAMGSFGDNSALLQTNNPLGCEYVPGGSSSGSAASVAAGFAAASIGSDTGGSVRIPASFCGLVGFKPTYGAISRFGLISYASSLDTVGVIAKTVEDVEILSKVLFGKDARDMTSHSVAAEEKVPINPSDITFSFSDADILDSEKEIQSAMLRVLRILERSGAKRIDRTIFGNSKMDDAYRIIACAEATSNLARYDGIKFGGASGFDFSETRDRLFGAEVKRRIEYGNFVLSAENFERYYRPAKEEQKRVVAQIDELFGVADVILSPVCDFVVPKFSEASSCRADRFTVAANFAGIPAISIPVGKDRNGMPISIQLMSRKCSDFRLLRIAQCIERLIGEEM